MPGTHLHRLVMRRVFAVVVGVLLASLGAAASAAAAPVWVLDSVHGPQNLPPGGTGQYVLMAFNFGDADSSGVVTLRDTLPAGVTATSFSGNGWSCPGLPATRVTCTRSTPVAYRGTDVNFRGAAPALFLNVSVDGNASGTGSNVATISGAGAATAATARDPTTISSTPAGFGIVPGSFASDFFDGQFPAGGPADQAGAHPFEMRVDFHLNLRLRSDDELGVWTEPAEFMRTVRVDLPPGFVGNPQATARCPSEGLYTQAFGERGTCPPNTQVGYVDIVLQDGALLHGSNTPNAGITLPVFNMEPPRGAVAAFAFAFLTHPVWMIVSLDPTDHSVVTTIRYTNDILQARSARMTLWGVPADPAHDLLRLNDRATSGATAFGVPFTGAPIRPFLTTPSQCGVDGTTRIELDSWQHPGTFVSAQSAPWQMTGCDDARFRFEPAIAVQPEQTTPGTPTGLDVDVSVPQKDDTVADATDLYAGSGEDAAIATPPLRDAAVTLPAGMAISPSSANGLASCSSAQIKLGTDDDPTCPDASKIGTATLTTPLLADPVPGAVYLAAQSDNPFGSLLAMYIVLHDADRGLTIKLPGRIALDPISGQLTTTFDDNPQLPFSNLHLHLKGGARAPLVTPATCGTKWASATLTSWNASLPAAHATSSFAIAGAGCAGRGFDPSFTAGTTKPVAGKDAPLVTRFARGDGDQELGAIDVSLPPGLLGRVASVDLCPTAAANAGTCGAASLVGSATVAAGPGSDPFYISTGRVYMTEGHKGAPFGLSIVVPAKAGPLDLGDVVVRAAILVDRRTAALRIKTDPLPTLVQGIPLKLRLAQVTVDRAGFTFNPTNCAAMSASATISSTEGATATKQSRFKVGRCAALRFRPRMTMTIGARHRTAKGASTPLTTTIRMGRGQANLRSVKVTLPSIVNARLGVVARACTPAQFEAGRCERARIGTAVARTPILDAPLRGSAYFVRTRPIGLPDMMIALRGQVAVDLVGTIRIPASNRLSTTFATIPDVPITSFALRLVAGRNGPLGTTANLCSLKGQTASVRLAFGAQSGKRIARSQQLKVKGCAGRATRHKAHRRR